MNACRHNTTPVILSQVRGTFRSSTSTEWAKATYHKSLVNKELRRNAEAHYIGQRIDLPPVLS